VNSLSSSFFELPHHQLDPHTTCAKSYKMASSVDAKLLKSTKFPPEFNKKVDMQKVNAEVMKKYVAFLVHPLPSALLTRWIVKMDRRQDLRNPWE